MLRDAMIFIVVFFVGHWFEQLVFMLRLMLLPATPKIFCTQLLHAIHGINILKFQSIERMRYDSIRTMMIDDGVWHCLLSSANANAFLQTNHGTIHDSYEKNVNNKTLSHQIHLCRSTFRSWIFRLFLFFVRSFRCCWIF